MRAAGEVFCLLKKEWNRLLAAAVLVLFTGAVLLTADHGNADKMYDPDAEHPFTAHTTNPVPFLVAGVEGAKLREGGVLADIAPTMLKILELPQPKEMTGRSILQ